MQNNNMVSALMRSENDVAFYNKLMRDDAMVRNVGYDTAFKSDRIKYLIEPMNGMVDVIDILKDAGKLNFTSTEQLKYIIRSITQIDKDGIHNIVRNEYDPARVFRYLWLISADKDGNLTVPKEYKMKRDGVEYTKEELDVYDSSKQLERNRQKISLNALVNKLARIGLYDGHLVRVKALTPGVKYDYKNHKGGVTPEHKKMLDDICTSYGDTKKIIENLDIVEIRDDVSDVYGDMQRYSGVSSCMSKEQYKLDWIRWYDDNAVKIAVLKVGNKMVARALLWEDAQMWNNETQSWDRVTMLDRVYPTNGPQGRAMRIWATRNGIINSNDAITDGIMKYVMQDTQRGGYPYMDTFGNAYRDDNCETVTLFNVDIELGRVRDISDVSGISDYHDMRHCLLTSQDGAGFDIEDNRVTCERCEDRFDEDDTYSVAMDEDALEYQTWCESCCEKHAEELDGEYYKADLVGRCEHDKCNVLLRDLYTCAVDGERYKLEYMATCVLTDELIYIGSPYRHDADGGNGMWVENLSGWARNDEMAQYHIVEVSKYHELAPRGKPACETPTGYIYIQLDKHLTEDMNKEQHLWSNVEISNSHFDFGIMGFWNNIMEAIELESDMTIEKAYDIAMKEHGAYDTCVVLMKGVGGSSAQNVNESMLECDEATARYYFDQYVDYAGFKLVCPISWHKPKELTVLMMFTQKRHNIPLEKSNIHMYNTFPWINNDGVKYDKIKK